MIHWKEIAIAYSESEKARFRDRLCRFAERTPDGLCVGYSAAGKDYINDDDEPHFICKACDKCTGGYYQLDGLTACQNADKKNHAKLADLFGILADDADKTEPPAQGA